jgi:hypothetical protein
VLEKAAFPNEGVLVMQDVEHTGLMNFPLQSEPMIDNRQQSYMGFQDIQTSQVGRFQSPNLSSPMMSLPTPPMPFLHPETHDSITQYTGFA